MNSVLLRFSERAIEQKYIQWRSSSLFVKIDRTFAYLNAAIFTIFGITEVLNNAPRAGLVLLALGFISYALQLAFMEIHGGELWLKHRNLFISLFRCFRVLLSIPGVPLWIRNPAVDFPSFLRWLALGSGAMLNVWMALGMPMLFRNHLLLQLPLALTMMVLTGWKTCDSPVQTEYSATAIVQVRQMLDGLLEWCVPQSTSRQVGDGSDDCIRLVSLSYVLISVLFPSFLLWILEINSRLAFVKEINRSSENGQSVDSIDPSLIPDRMRVLALTMISILALLLVF